MIDVVSIEVDGPASKKMKLSNQDARNVSLFMRSSRHPLNVKPSGNAYLPVLTKNQGVSRENQMGYLSVLPDDLLMTLLSFVDDASTLKNISHTSRVMYAYLHDEDVWKKLYIKMNNPQLEWMGSWKCTVLGLPQGSQANLQLPDNLLCSDVLYRPFQCSQINYEQVFSKIIKEETMYHKNALLNIFDPLPNGRILRIPEDKLSLDEFNSSYHDAPFILTNTDRSRWPSWSFDTLLQRFPDVKFRQEAVEWDLKSYDQYLKRNQDESPLYLFDCNSVAMKTLKQEYKAPKIFQEDLFTVFSNNEQNCRPDHAWLIVGPKRSGSTFHKDPNYTSAWNAALTGRKLWIMLPPHITPPGVGTDDEESEVTSPVGIAEWVISGFFNDCLKIEECLIGISFPGECMYVPSGWWHSVINLDDSVALTQNFVPTSKLTNALNFLKNKRNQLSGFHPNQVNSSISALLNQGIPDNENTQELRKYHETFMSLNLTDETLIKEDCGETLTLPAMPIFELFKQLMILDENETILNSGLDSLDRLERKEVGKSKTWEKLTDDNLPAFSFGFQFDNDSDDE